MSRVRAYAFAFLALIFSATLFAQIPPKPAFDGAPTSTTTTQWPGNVPSADARIEKALNQQRDAILELDAKVKRLEARIESLEGRGK
jgi:TolA-binding protein